MTKKRKEISSHHEGGRKRTASLILKVQGKEGGSPPEGKGRGVTKRKGKEK